MTMEMTDKVSTIVVTDVVEHEDGSATYTFDLDKDSSQKITGIGLDFILTCGTYGVDIQDALDYIAKLGNTKEQDNDNS